MTVTLFELTYKLARLLGTLSEGVATGGGTTSLIDTSERSEDDDYWTGGTLWVTVDAGGVGAAPENEFSYISANVSSTKTLTLRDTLTAALAAGDRYAVSTPRYPLQLLIQKVNEVLGRIEKTDTSITMAGDQLEYSLPVDVINLKKVYIATNSDADANAWERLFDWDVQKTPMGTADILVFQRNFSGYVVKLVYLAYPAPMRVSTDQLDEGYHELKIITNAAVACLLWRKTKVGNSDDTVNDLLNYFQNLAAKTDLEYEPALPKKSAKTIKLVM